MPTYDYECRSCRHAFEVFEGISASGPRECPRCGRRRAHRLLGTGAGLIFKGPGFYVTDYKKSGVSPAPASASKPKKSEAPKPSPS